MTRHRALSPAARALLVELASGASPWRHGYDLSKVIGVPSGTLYPLLLRLSEQGHLESRWDDPLPGQRPRHSYRLTASGLRLAHDCAAPPARDAALAQART